VPAPLAPADLQCTSPFWTPDAGTIFFLAGVTDGSGSQSDSVARARADGSGFTRAIPISRFPTGALWGHGSVSPDGTKMVLAVPDDGLYVTALDGAGITRISASPQGRFEYGPVWSPDGTHLAFFSTPGSDLAGSGSGAASDLIVMSADGSGRSTVTTLAAPLVCVPFVAWSPGGTKLAFNSCVFDKNISAPVIIWDLATATGTPLTSGPGVFADGPSWVP
jgi:Tol biopolymer transport system component